MTRRDCIKCPRVPPAIEIESLYDFLPALGGLAIELYVFINYILASPIPSAKFIQIESSWAEFGF